MLRKYTTFYCPICNTPLGSHNSSDVVILTCPTDDCAVKWCWKPKEKLPMALSYPGMKESKKCTCGNCGK